MTGKQPQNFTREKVESMLKALDTGIMQGGVIENCVPGQILKAANTLEHGSLQEVAHLLRSLPGSGLDMSAGTSLGGGDAITAMADVVAQYLVVNREQITVTRLEGVDVNLVFCLHLSQRTKERLLDWVFDQDCVLQGGKSVKTSDLAINRIGDEFLTEQGLRLGACGVYLSGLQILESILRAFIEG